MKEWEIPKLEELEVLKQTNGGETGGKTEAEIKASGNSENFALLWDTFLKS